MSADVLSSYGHMSSQSLSKSGAGDGRLYGARADARTGADAGVARGTGLCMSDVESESSSLCY